MKGPEAFRPIVKTFRGAFPDIHITVERTITQGELVSVHCLVEATHTGPTLGIAPTGTRVRFEGMTIARVVHGQFREGWNCFYFLIMYQQLGLVPPVP